jgi:hypothetical protein
MTNDTSYLISFDGLLYKSLGAASRKSAEAQGTTEIKVFIYKYSLYYLRQRTFLFSLSLSSPSLLFLLSTSLYLSLPLSPSFAPLPSPASSRMASSNPAEWDTILSASQKNNVSAYKSVQVTS